MLKFTTGVEKVPVKAVLYGPPGVGKTTTAVKATPKPFILDVERGSFQIEDASRYPDPIDSWTMLESITKDFLAGGHPFATLVADSLSAIEDLACKAVLAENNWPDMEYKNYGACWAPVQKKFGEYLDLLTEVSKKYNVVLVGHSTVKSFTPPDQDGAYDRYLLELNTKVASKVKKWTDNIFFANYQTIVVDDEKSKKQKGQGQRRVLYTEHAAAWDAKNRFNLPKKIDLGKYDQISHIFLSGYVGEKPVVTENKPATEARVETQEPFLENKSELKQEETKPVEAKAEAAPEEKKEIPLAPKPTDYHAALYSLMEKDGLTAEQVQKVVELRKPGTYPVGTAIELYSEGFVNGWIVKNWPALVAFVKKEGL